MNAYWSRCGDCVSCTVCGEVAFCHSPPRNGPGGPALCDTHTREAA